MVKGTRVAFTSGDSSNPVQSGLDIREQVEASLGRTMLCFDRIDAHLSYLLYSRLEGRFREHAAAYLRRLVHRPTPLTTQQLVELMDSRQAVDRLSEDEREDVLYADLVVHGRRESNGSDILLAVEVSVEIAVHDVDRAARRAGLLCRLLPTLPEVAGESIAADTACRARTSRTR